MRSLPKQVTLYFHFQKRLPPFRFFGKYISNREIHKQFVHLLKLKSPKIIMVIYSILFESPS